MLFPGTRTGDIPGLMSRCLPRSSTAVFALAATAVVASPARAQLRPLEPLDWSTLGVEEVSLVMGGGIFTGQRASLAGTEGRLLELGSFRATWSLGRVALELAGTALRLFNEQFVFADPIADVVPVEGAWRHDVGDYRVSTVVRLLEPRPGRTVALRFGVRLPTTDNLQGLDRDETDFYSLLAGRIAQGPLAVGGELGVGIYGTRDPENEQVDPLLFGLSALYDLGRVRGLLELTGQHDTRAGRDRRGTEDLGEARIGVEVGDRRWMSVAAVRGWTPSSPEFGVIVRFGTHF
jgi:hypothetical protein